MDPAFIINALVTFFNNSSTLHVVLAVYATVGWLIFFYLLLYAGVYLFEKYRQDLNEHRWKFVVLAIDIPLLNVQTPKAVEQMFNHLAGSFDTPTFRERFVDGYKQRWFSFEIISIEGYIQFLVWTEVAFRDLVEASIYAQYPEAEIVEVEDYVHNSPERFPNDEYDGWMGDFGLAESDAYPIRTYAEFEHNISKDTVLKDPMGTFLESFTRIGKGEQMWFQILVEPISGHWKEKAIDKINEFIGETRAEQLHHGHHGGGFFDFLIKIPMSLFEYFGDQFFTQVVGAEAVGEAVKPAEPNQIRYMTPGQKTLVEAMEKKIAKIGFKTKMRAIYLAKKGTYDFGRGIAAVIGAVSQFNIPTANSIIPKQTTKQPSLAKKYRKQNKLLKAYKKRKIKPGGPACILNIEELATIWHFPMSHVKTPLVQKAATKQAEPPAGLPMESAFSETTFGAVESEKPEVVEPPKRTFTTDTGDIVEYDE